MRTFICGFCLILYDKFFQVRILDDPDLNTAVWVLFPCLLMAFVQDVAELRRWR